MRRGCGDDLITHTYTLNHTHTLTHSLAESPTLTKEEKKLVIKTVIDTVNKRVPVIAGTGSNNTKETVEMTRWAMEAGADGALVVNPYYNKPTQEGIYAHYKAVSEVGIPIVLYNVPGRTGGTGIAPETTVKLAKLPNICAIKEASANLATVTTILRDAPPSFVLLSGDDSLTLPMLSLGAKGVISVLSNISPEHMLRIVDPVLQGKGYESARAEHMASFDLMNNMFVEANPSPVKYAASKMGLCTDTVRLPLVPLTASSKTLIEKTITASGLL
jgi:4-hydroxy-tetrahydrodipicolinate synthase